MINRVWSGLLKDNLNRVHQLNKHLLYFCREEENEGDVAGNAEADVQSTGLYCLAGKETHPNPRT